MPKGSQKQSYPVSTGLIFVLVVIGTGAYLLRRTIPPPPINNLGTETATYLVSGSREPVEWFALDEKAFQEAARTDRLILLAIGTPASRAARAAEVSAFMDLELAEELRQSYVSVRVDLFDMPAWQNAYLPISRAQIGLDPSFQIWILDPKASMFQWFLRRSPSDRADAYTLLGLIRAARKDVAKLQLSGKGMLAAGEAQRMDVTAAMEADETPFDLDTHLRWLSNHIHPKFGGILAENAMKVSDSSAQVFQRPQPWAWRYMLRMGRADLAARSMDPMLLSPMVDWVGGGFFRQANRINWRDVEADQYSRISADTMAALALRWSIDDDPLSKLLAEQAFDSLAGKFVRENGIACYATVAEGYFGRNAHSSFGPLQMRELFSADDREWLRENLDLRVESNLQMMPYLKSRETLKNDPVKLATIFAQMRDARKDIGVEYGRSDYADVNGYVCARLIESALILGDLNRLSTARGRYLAMRKFRVGPDDVLHSLAGDRGSVAYLGDYLGFADAALFDSLGSGDLSSAREGLEILKRSLFRFGTRAPGVTLDGLLDHESPWPSDVQTSDFCDDIGESSTAALARICNDYARLLPLLVTHEEPLKKLLSDTAKLTVDHASSLMPAIQAEASAIACAAWNVSNLELLVSVGKNCVHEAISLRRKHPNALVCPVQSISDRQPGSYQVTSSGEWKLISGSN